MSKNGQAKVLSNDEFSAVLDEIENHRYPSKKALIIQISFKLGLRAQEMSLLRIREVETLSHDFPQGYKLKDVLYCRRALPRALEQWQPLVINKTSAPVFDSPLLNSIAW